MPPSPPAAFAPPPRAVTDRGAPRRVGVELEMNGIDLDAVAACVADALGLAVDAPGRYERRLTGDPAGPWQVEVDSSWLKRMGRHEAGPLARSAEEAVAYVVEALLPMEVVSPPLPLDRLPEVDGLVARLREAGAIGTSGRLVNAFGMQLNPEAPSLAPGAVAAVLKAFLCLYDWLFAQAEVDPARRLTGFVDPFPTAFVRRVVAPGYAPGMAGLIDDYLAANPTRNRALDLLPLFAHLDGARVRRAVADDRVRGRPAYHYRLPNCEIDRPGWGIGPSWNDWVEVERLAADEGRLAACGAAYAGFLDRTYDRWLGDWRGEVERRWLGR